MSTGLYSGYPGLSGTSGFAYTAGLWSGAPGFADGAYGPDFIFGDTLAYWYDNQDLTTMFADYTMTPATVGSAVALQLDKSQRGALGSDIRATGAVQLLGSATVATYNTGTGVGQVSRVDASNFSWIKFTSAVVGRPYFIDIENTGAVSLLVRDNATTYATVTAGQRVTVFVPAVVTDVRVIPSAAVTNNAFTVHSVKEVLGTPRYQTTAAQRPILGRHPKGGRRNLLVATATMSTQSVTVRAVAHTLAFTGTGTVTLSGTSTAGPLVGTGAGDRVTLTFTPTAGSLTLTVSGSVTLAQLQEGSADTAYQAVATQYDCTETGVPDCYYLQADGSDDGMVTPTLDLSATDKIGVFTAVRKLSDATAAMLLESSALYSSSNGTILLAAPASAGLPRYTFYSRGTSAAAAASPSSFAAPTTNVVTGTGDISGDSAILRVNGAEVASAATDQGTGNFGNYALYFFRRGGTTLPFNGLEYGGFACIGLPSADQIAAAEAYQNNFVGAY